MPRTVEVPVSARTRRLWLLRSARLATRALPPRAKVPLLRWAAGRVCVDVTAGGRTQRIHIPARVEFVARDPG